MSEGPCGWTAEPCQDCCDDTIEQVGPEMWATTQALAVFILWKATGGAYGVCETTYRPCRRDCGGSFGWPYGAPWIPWRINDQWVNLSCSTCPGECGCGGSVSEIRLPSVEAVTNIRIDGVDFDPEAVAAVYNRNRIVRIDGDQWPGCQNLSSKDGIGTWSITVLQGLPVPAGGEMLAGVLACELAKLCVGDSSCRLPSNWTALTRQGVSLQRDPSMSLPDLATGIDEIDLWVAATRFVKFSTPGILSPDRPPPARLTWPVPDPVPSGGMVPLA